MTNTVTLTNPTINGGTAVKIKCDKVSLGWKNNTDSKPTPNSFAVTEVMKNSFENPVYKIKNAMLISGTNYLTQSLLQQFAKNRYAGTSATRTTLIVTYGLSDTALLASDCVTTSIPVEVEDFTFNLDQTDSEKAYVPTVDINLRETK